MGLGLRLEGPFLVFSEGFYKDHVSAWFYALFFFRGLHLRALYQDITSLNAMWLGEFRVEASTFCMAGSRRISSSFLNMPWNASDFILKAP